MLNAILGITSTKERKDEKRKEGRDTCSERGEGGRGKKSERMNKREKRKEIWNNYIIINLVGSKQINSKYLSVIIIVK